MSNEPRETPIAIVNMRERHFMHFPWRTVRQFSHKHNATLRHHVIEKHTIDHGHVVPAGRPEADVIGPKSLMVIHTLIMTLVHPENLIGHFVCVNIKIHMFKCFNFCRGLI